MRILVFPLLLLLCSALHLPAADSAFIANKVLVKFSSRSAIGESWLEQKRIGQIDEWLHIIGAHTTSPYIADNTLIAIRQAIKQRSATRLTVSNFNNLERIAVISYTNNIDPHVVAAKLRTQPFIENVQAIPVQRLVGVPNDPYFDQQYHLPLIQAAEAWDHIPMSGKSIVVGVVDTGLDTAHIDINQNFWRNPNETGLDDLGRDKRSNAVDDDGNGFVDDWFGWDFVGSNGTTQDNSPLPGNDHGTHVGGLIGAAINNFEGVCGTANNVRIMPVKVGRDSPSSTSVERTADAILYAAASGANIINCSFGSSSPTFADSEVIDVIEELGALLVAAAGNDQTDQAFYPASHQKVLSVASTDEGDRKSFFSNIHRTVDVAAPGTMILSTVPGNRFDYMDGTSMASPIVAGIAAMTYSIDTTVTPNELRALIKANVDNIDTLNTAWVGKLGTGRVNALSAVKRTNQRLAEVVSTSFRDDDGDSLFLPLNTLRILVDVKNVLNPLISTRIVVTPAPSTFMPVVDVPTADLGAMARGEQKSASNEIVVILPDNVPQNATLSLVVTIYDADTLVGRDLIEQTVHPTYRTIHENNIALTVNSVGNLGYNDYPANTQGVGCLFNDGTASLLFEGAFLVGNDAERLSDVARGQFTSYRNEDFTTNHVAELKRDSVVDGARVIAGFEDDTEFAGLGVRINKSVYARTADSLRNVVYVVYDITNSTENSIKNIHAALFMDWDLGPSGSDNGCAWDNQYGIGVLQNAVRTDIPSVGVSMISDLRLDFFAVDNGGSQYSPSIYDSFTDAEKWSMMSNGLARTNSRITDVSLMIGGGPFTLAPQATQQICFVIGIGSTFQDMATAITKARSAAADMNLNTTPFKPLTLSDTFIYLANGNAITPGITTAQYALRSVSSVTIDFVDFFGRSVGGTFYQDNVPSGIHNMTVEIPNVATGTYFLRFTTASGVQFLPIQIIP